jgi:2-C-methyl-D-erythritol 2,4-cyclodiphosphate synthase
MMVTRFGIGFDIHQLVEGRPLVLGGVVIPFELGLSGDSDADVLCHAIIDALLGSASLGDIGSFFGVGTPELMGIKSLDLLSKTHKHLQSLGYKITNIDSTIIAQKPNLSKFREEMIKNLKGTLVTENISVKFTTPKHIGALGNSEGVACLAIAGIQNTLKE